jgi:predicted ATPase
MLDRIELAGFKSIREMNLELSRLNVLIGANGAGKSNLISFFKLFNHLMSNNLQQHIARQDMPMPCFIMVLRGLHRLALHLILALQPVKTFII